MDSFSGPVLNGKESPKVILADHAAGQNYKEVVLLVEGENAPPIVLHTNNNQPLFFASDIGASEKVPTCLSRRPPAGP
jgi:hypothetical protein